MKGFSCAVRSTFAFILAMISPFVTSTALRPAFIPHHRLSDCDNVLKLVNQGAEALLDVTQHEYRPAGLIRQGLTSQRSGGCGGGHLVELFGSAAVLLGAKDQKRSAQNASSIQAADHI